MKRLLLITLLAPLLVACGDTEPPEPTPIGQVCETRVAYWFPIYVGKSVSMFPAYKTECWIEEQK